MTAPGQVQSPVNTPKTPPYKIAGLVLLVIFLVIVALVWTQFRGGFADPEKLTLISSRSGLSMDPGHTPTTICPNGDTALIGKAFSDEVAFAVTAHLSKVLLPAMKYVYPELAMVPDGGVCSGLGAP